MADSIKVLHLSTHDEECGIAIYQQNIVDAMGAEHPVQNVFFDISPNKLKLMTGRKLDAALDELFSQLKDFDILHIQHEYSFYNGNQLQRIVDGAKALGRRVVVTLHTPPHAHRRNIPRSAPRGLHPRTWRHAKRVADDDKQFVTCYITPLQSADILVANSRASVESFTSYGVDPAKFVVIELPVPAVDFRIKSDVIAKELNKQSGDIILSTTGFLSETKGIMAAVKALTYLPSHYKLAVVGGAHPSSQNNDFYERVCDKVYELNLQNRFFITGYVERDQDRDAMLRETDICLYPYDRGYYDYVSSAALTNAIANELPIVAYKTRTFLEANDTVPFIDFCQAATYYELARTIRHIDVDAGTRLVKQYAEAFSVKKQAERFTQLYLQLVGT